jgi:predicted Zn-dependent protease
MTLNPIRFLGLILCLSCLSCATTPISDIAPGEKPAIESDEAGLWMYMDDIEKNLKTSGRIETDPVLNAYVAEIICRLVPDYCSDIRFYIVRTPHFNATMAPNGAMQIWTGLMLRAQNEAQLAYVIGHEIGHYQRRHSLKQWRSVRDTSSVLIFFQLAAAGAGVGYAGDMAALVAVAGLFAYSRDQEREADDIGFEFMANAGYDFHEAANIWQALIEEHEAADYPDEIILFSTHPSTEERVKTLRKMAQQLESESKSGEKHQADYLARIRPFRAGWLQNELRKRDYAASQVVLNHLFKTGEDSGELNFFQGELYRLRGQEDDIQKAIASYQKSVSFDEYPPAAHRALGLLYRKTGKIEEARLEFRKYLAVAPTAPDYQMIEFYLEELKSNDSK